MREDLPRSMERPEHTASTRKASDLILVYLRSIMLLKVKRTEKCKSKYPRNPFESVSTIQMTVGAGHL